MAGITILVMEAIPAVMCRASSLLFLFSSQKKSIVGQVLKRKPSPESFGELNSPILLTPLSKILQDSKTALFLGSSGEIDTETESVTDVAIMGLHLMEMAEGFVCYASGEVEARNVYTEIFENHCYGGPELHLSSEAPFIIDAGAHIGLFSLYMKQEYPLAKIIAFEPAPETSDALHKNLDLHNVSGVVTYPYGLGSKASTETLTYYPAAHANTTFVPKEKELMKKLIAEGLGQDFANELFDNVEIPVPINRLSHFLDRYHSDVVEIDLLKIDVEGMELDVLGGVDDTHWPLVRNVVLEVSDVSGVLSKIEQVLQAKGFTVTSVHQGGVEELKMYLVMGHRDPDVPS
ncbi:hypothetical protein AJ80_07823 [Polytolypa hystricis UAMH7299]|uniref:Methyltransferase FkbM domain-containing protein n=1 Tax=Polytolypa hystricis (strain UAMH7299) TaxID=1447883 RepID=A0A2B7XJ25_POLH7|nr:hypothetical protein AJ80_07823 [Polytolypa hystricis UAMH7299]